MQKAYRFTKSKRLWREAHKVIPGGSQATRAPSFPEFPIYFDHAKGCRMWDIDGNEFIDFLCSIGPVLLGYAYKPVDDKVRAIMKTSFQSSMNHPVVVDLARRLVELIPCAEQVRFLKTGTDATVAAARLARFTTGRTWIARCGYHGWADMWWRGRTEGVQTAAWEVVPPFDGTPEGLEKVFKETGEKFAAVILCPADTKPFTTENYQGIVDVAHKHGALVIFDEVKSGFRVALGGAQEVLGVTPDLTTVSKGIANGYPLSAIVGKREIMEGMNKTPTAGTFSGEGVSLTAALATLDEMKKRNVVAHLYKVGQRLIDGMNEIAQSHGFDEAIAYADPVPSMPRFVFKRDDDFWDHPAHNPFFQECIRYGLFLSSWHVAFVNYSHKNRDIDEALEIFDWAMGKTKRKLARKKTAKA